MNDEELSNLLKYSNNGELYIVSTENKLKLLKCPFLVIAIREIAFIKEKQIVKVDQVKVDRELITIFVIMEESFFYYHFSIIDI